MIRSPDPAEPGIVIVVRQSPDWRDLAERSERGAVIDPSAYLPPASVLNFPHEMQRCIETWNGRFSVDFFRCREVLRIIARATLNATARSRILSYADLPGGLPSEPYRLFFVDDDDWFAPDAADRLKDCGDEDVAVFPLPRIDGRIFTFCRRPPPSGVALGRLARAPLRYMTNNYGLHPRLCSDPGVFQLADHHSACQTADARGLRDADYDVVVSITNKSPVSASVLETITGSEDGFRDRVEAYVRAVAEIVLPPGLAWARAPLAATRRLFERALTPV